MYSRRKTQLWSFPQLTPCSTKHEGEGGGRRDPSLTLFYTRILNQIPDYKMENSFYFHVSQLNMQNKSRYHRLMRCHHTCSIHKTLAAELIMPVGQAGIKWFFLSQPTGQAFRCMLHYVTTDWTIAVSRSPDNAEWGVIHSAGSRAIQGWNHETDVTVRHHQCHNSSG